MRREKQDPPPAPTRRGRNDEMTEDALEFVRAIDEFKRRNNKPFPTWTDVLKIVKDLGYRKAPAHDRSSARARD